MNEELYGYYLFIFGFLALFALGSLAFAYLYVSKTNKEHK